MDTTLWSAFNKLKLKFAQGVKDEQGTGTSVN